MNRFSIGYVKAAIIGGVCLAVSSPMLLFPQRASGEVFDAWSGQGPQHPNQRDGLQGVSRTMFLNGSPLKVTTAKGVGPADEFLERQSEADGSTLSSIGTESFALSLELNAPPGEESTGWFQSRAVALLLGEVFGPEDDVAVTLAMSQGGGELQVISIEPLEGFSLRGLIGQAGRDRPGRDVPNLKRPPGSIRLLSLEESSSQAGGLLNYYQCPETLKITLRAFEAEARAGGWTVFASRTASNGAILQLERGTQSLIATLSATPSGTALLVQSTSPSAH